MTVEKDVCLYFFIEGKKLNSCTGNLTPPTHKSMYLRLGVAFPVQLFRSPAVFLLNSCMFCKNFPIFQIILRHSIFFYTFFLVNVFYTSLFQGNLTFTVFTIVIFGCQWTITIFSPNMTLSQPPWNGSSIGNWGLKTAQGSDYNGKEKQFIIKLS